MFINKISILAALIILIYSLNSEISINNDQMGEVSIRGGFVLTEREDGTTQINQCDHKTCYQEWEIPIYTELISLPAQGNLQIDRLKLEYQDAPLTHLPDYFSPALEATGETMFLPDQWLPSEPVMIAKPSIMRGSRFTQLSICPIQFNPKRKQVRLLIDIEADLSNDLSSQINPLALNRNPSVSSFDLGTTEFISGGNRIETSEQKPYLIITPPNLVQYLEPLVIWKKRLGHNTVVATTSETGTTNVDIQNYLQNAYDNWDEPPYFVILVGDVSGSIIVPSFYVQGYLTPWDVSDHPYTLLEGDDYFPDIMLGRLSVQDITTLQTVVNKIIKYESTPYTGSDWFNRSLMVSYVTDSFTSARETVMAVREKLLDFTYTEVDTFISPYQFNSGQLTTAINEGHTFINYRGAGGPYYWWGGYGILYDSQNVNQLSNGFMLPMVTSMTCGGGDFAYSGDNRCLGEYWLSAGNPSVPKAGIGFIGPSEYDTKTPFNNANDMGIYQGITQEGLYRCGEMLLRGKMELYNNYPYCHEWGDATNSDQFYFYVYNLLGDPGLSVWTDFPDEFDLLSPDQICAGTNFLTAEIDLLLGDRADFTVTITSDTELLAQGKTDVSGKVNLICPQIPGSYTITASRYGFIPQTSSLEITANNILSVSSFNFQDLVTPGSETELAITVTNFSEQTIESAEISLSCASELIGVSDQPQELPLLSPGGSVELVFEMTVASEWYSGDDPQIIVQIDSELGENHFLITVPISSPYLEISDFMVDNEYDRLIQNSIETCFLQLENKGNLETGDFQIEISNLDDNTIIYGAVCEFSSILSGEFGLNDECILIQAENVISGSTADFLVKIFDLSDNHVQSLEFTSEIGIIQPEDPTFSDCGYLAIESTDAGDFPVPEYDWIEIDPYLGGSGFQIFGDHVTLDGFISTINLPFEFRFFDLNYDRISICSNGYLAMGETELIFFRNRNIPSGSGASAIIAPFWDNLANGRLCYLFNASDHSLIIEWSEWDNVYNPYYQETFQVILYDPDFYQTTSGNGLIKFQYKQISNPDVMDNYATVGIENHTKTDGLCLSFANIYPASMHLLSNNTSIMLTPQIGATVSSQNIEVPLARTRLLQNYPNPFNPETVISFFIVEQSRVNLSVYNIKGQKINELVNENLSSGYHEVLWSPDHARDSSSSGIYLYQLRIDNKIVDSRKCLLLK